LFISHLNVSKQKENEQNIMQLTVEWGVFVKFVFNFCLIKYDVNSNILIYHIFM